MFNNECLSRIILSTPTSVQKMVIRVKQDYDKFGVVSFDCNHVEGFQKSEKLETLYGFNLGDAISQ